MQESELIIDVKNIQKTFGNVEVIKDVSFSVRKGQVLGIIGPSGSGKSTILRCVTQLETVSDGSISICGEPLVSNGIYSSKEVQKNISLKVGLVFQNFNLFPHYSVLENVVKPQITVLKKTKDEAEKEARRLLEKMNLSYKENNYPCELSGGQQQRVSIARALALKPEVLFFDEPTSALDPELTGEILKVIKDLASEKMTMVVVTHEMAFARDLCDYVMFIDGGIVVEEGNPVDIIENPKQERTKLFLKRFSEK
jgi:polar amino acid transport system ATP-binding protein